MAQGVANFVVPFFGGMPATGTIARTVTNVRAGGTTPVAGIVHALTLALIVMLAAPLALLVPLSVLAGILFFVAWNMGEWREFAHLRRHANDYRLKLLGTFALTVVFDLTVAVQVGLLAACLLFIHKMSALFSVERTGPRRRPHAVQPVRLAVLRRHGQDRSHPGCGGARPRPPAGGAGRAAPGAPGHLRAGHAAPVAQGGAAEGRDAAAGQPARAAARTDRAVRVCAGAGRRGAAARRSLCGP